MPALGVWDAFDPVGASPVGYGAGTQRPGHRRKLAAGQRLGDDVVRLGIADERGDGRPDYRYQGWVLYADTVPPQRLPASGGPIVIHGMGFRLADTVLVGGQPAIVTSISPNEITAIAPPAANGVTGSVDVEVDDLPIYYAAAIISDGISYDSGTGDALTLMSANAHGHRSHSAFRCLSPSSPSAPISLPPAVYGHLYRHQRTATLACGSLLRGQHHRRRPRHH